MVILHCTREKFPLNHRNTWYWKNWQKYKTISGCLGFKGLTIWTWECISSWIGMQWHAKAHDVIAFYQRVCEDNPLRRERHCSPAHLRMLCALRDLKTPNQPWQTPEYVPWELPVLCKTNIATHAAHVLVTTFRHCCRLVYYGVCR